MIDKIWSWFRNMFTRKQGIEQALGRIVLTDPGLENKLIEWDRRLKNDKGLKLEHSICNEMSIYTTLEFNTEIKGDKNTEYLNEQYQKNIVSQTKKLSYYLGGVGSVVVKLFVRNGRILGKIIPGGYYYPLVRNELNELTSCAFLDTIKKSEGQKVVNYTLIETHEWDEKTLDYTITYKVYKNENENQFSLLDNLGTEISLLEVPEWSHLNPKDVFHNIETTMCFQEFARDDFSSLFDVALNLIDDANKQYAGVKWEYESKETAVFADIDLFKVNKARSNKSSVNEVHLEMEDGNNRLYRKMDFNATGTETNKIQEYSPDIRDENYFRGLNEYKRNIEFVCGLAYGTITKQDQIEKTAEEIRASKQRFWATITAFQDIIKEGYIKVVKSMEILAIVYKLSAIGKYDVTFTFGDSIMEDPEKEFVRRLQMVNSGYLKAEQFIAWYFGLEYDESNPAFIESLAQLMPKQIEDEEEPEEE